MPSTIDWGCMHWCKAALYTRTPKMQTDRILADISTLSKTELNTNESCTKGQ